MVLDPCKALSRSSPCAFRKVRPRTSAEPTSASSSWGSWQHAAPGRGCFALAILLAIVENKLGREDSPSRDPQSRDSRHQGKSWTHEGWIPWFFSGGEEKDPFFLTLMKGWKIVSFSFSLELILLPSPPDILPLLYVAKEPGNLALRLLHTIHIWNPGLTSRYYNICQL